MLRPVKNWLKTCLRLALGLPALLDFIQTSKPGSIFSCHVNGMDLLAPVEMLRMWPHCLHPSADEKLTYFVETPQSDWLCSKLRPGDVALDIGAGFGVITVALSKSCGHQGHVYAFEPAHTSRKYLQKVLDLNDIHNVIVVKSAISDKVGFAEFIEYTSENELAWAPDASTLAEGVEPTMDRYRRYGVEVTTIDDYVTAMGIQPKAIKIDIEGFELYALHGAKGTLENFSPYICVDIHKDVKTGKSAAEEVEPYLSALGYEFHMEGHALYAQKKR